VNTENEKNFVNLVVGGLFVNMGNENQYADNVEEVKYASMGN
jgi:hypothetical protein